MVIGCFTTAVAFGLLTFGLWTAPITAKFTAFGHLAAQAGFVAAAMFVITLFVVGHV